MRPSSRDDFAIAIICALALEAEAVEALFDETYDRLSAFYKKQPGDNNAYFNGRIGSHNVVLCLMPRMGKGNAASVAASLKISYRGIQVALVVGICGGAPYSPTKEDIFLGDVIVSDAVIEYDFGRQYQGGFMRKTSVKDTLGRPNREIQSLLAGLQPQQSRRDFRAKMLQHLRVIQTAQPRWRQPSSADDVLYEASYQHKHYGSDSPPLCSCLDDTSDEVCQAALKTTCILLGCAQDQICRRRDWSEICSPTIQIGIVASADTVMKSSEYRDDLVKSEGVIGFEMEGAGVWNNISCIIIKGVCDYVDSHKDKAWQAYAAATGAATANAFLEFWDPTVREGTNEFYIPLDLTGVPAIEEFIGREEELSCLWKYLQPTNARTRKVAVLHGLGGIGKTQLAIHFARKHKDDFTAIFWLSGKDRSALVTSLSSCLPRIQHLPMDIQVTNEEEAEQRANQVLLWLAKPDNTRWLIIFDNIDQYSLVQGHDDSKYDLYEFFPNADHGSIIITSRLRKLTELGKSFPVHKLSHEDATRLLLQSSGFSIEDILRTGTKQDVTGLAGLLDGLSLAIVIAGSFMRQTGTNVKEYLELYQNSWSDLQSQSGPTRHYQQGNMVQTWMVTYQEIQKCDPTAAKLLLLLAFFDNRDIWYELLRSGLDCCDPPPWFEMAVSSKLAFKTKVKALVGFSLVETKQQGGSYALHPVVQDWCHHVAGYNNLTSQLHELALMSVGYMVPHNSEREYAEIQQRLLPHANYLISREKDHWQNDTIDIWNALHMIGDLYSDQGILNEAERMYQRALAGYEKALGPDHSSTLYIVNNLGVLHFNQGKLKEAEEMYQRALAGYKKALGPDHSSTLNIVHNLGSLYKAQGKLKEAEEMYQRALVGKEKALGPDHSSTLNIVHNLGLLYADQGKLKEAEEMYQRAWQARRN
ncbi:tetratricopeptide repeat domain protein [Aspergillus flavus]|nr:tetratricopeptide repeat domain protein [Aspergillus flavus]